MVNKSQYSQFIKAEALKLGFMFCGISKAGFLEEEAPRLENWLKNGFNCKIMVEYKLSKIKINLFIKKIIWGLLTF